MGTESNRNTRLAHLIGPNAVGLHGDHEGNMQESDYSFEHGHGLGLDTVIHGGGVADSGDWAIWSASAGMAEDMPAFVHDLDTSLLSSPTSDGGLGAPRGVTSHPVEPLASDRSHNHHSHRRTGSTGFVRGHNRHGSLTASDATTPNSPHGQRNSGVDIPDDITLPGHDGEGSPNERTPSGHGKGGDDDDAPPPWSELKTKAGKDRKRLPLACIACRRKKIRCSGEKPACKHCLRSRIPCVYKVSTRKAAPRTDYMVMLDKRLKRMEERVIKIIPKDDQDNIVSATGRAVVKPPLPPAPPKPGGSKKRAADHAFGGDELDDWASAQPSRIETSSSQPQPSQILQSEALKSKHADEYSLQHEGADKLPSKELQEHLAEIFFDYVYGQSYHLLHKPSFMRKLAQGTVPPVLMLAVCAISARFSNHPAVRTEPAFLRGEEWAAPARAIALKRYDTPTITILIVYMIIGMHEFGTCQGGRSWMLSGMAQRMAYALQLHRDLHHDPRERAGDRKAELSPTDREIRRRTMWACFLMDRFTSSGTERPIFVGEQYISAQLPIKESYFQMEVSGPTEDLDGHVPQPVDPGGGLSADARENMGVAAYVIRLVALWGRLVHYMNLGGKERDQRPMWDEASTFSTLRREVRRWQDTLPASLHYNEENLQNHASERIANQFLFMHITYHQVLLFMHRFALPMPGVPRPAFPADVPSPFVAEAAAIAREAANQISTLVHEAIDYQVVVPFVGYAAFFSSTVHLQGVFAQNPQLEAASKRYLAYNVKYLTKIKKHWGMFHFVTENLRELYRKNADAVRAGARAPSGGRRGPAAATDADSPHPHTAGDGDDSDPGIFQYGDWFDRYPHGVSGTDYEGPSTAVKREPGADAVLGQKSDLQTVEEFFAKLTPPSRAASGPGSAAATAAASKKTSGNPSAIAAKRRRSSKHNGHRPSRSTIISPTQPAQPPSTTPDADAAAPAGPRLESPSGAPRPHIPHDFAASSSTAGPDDFATPYAAPFVTPGFAPSYPHPHHAPNPLLLDLAAPQQHATYLRSLDPDIRMAGSGGGGMDFHPENPFDFSAWSGVGLGPGTEFWSGGTGMGGGGGGGGMGSVPGHAHAHAVAAAAADPSATWFMPFNVEPPTIGDDHNLFQDEGNFDWVRNPFAIGFGDEVVQGLAAGQEMVGDGGGGQDRVDGVGGVEGGGSALDGMEGL